MTPKSVHQRVRFIGIALALLLIVLAQQACQSSSSEPTGTGGNDPEPGNQPSDGANGSPSNNKINTAGWVDSPWISPDGQQLYFMYSRYSFFPIFTGGSPVLAGPSRPGHHNNDVNPFDDSDIYVSSRKPDGTWGAPANFASNDSSGDCCMMVVGNPQRLYHTKAGMNGSTDIVYKQKNSDGSWSVALNLGPNVNSTTNEDNPHISQDQTVIWFTSSRSGGMGGKDIWIATYQNGAWTPATNVGAPINTAADEDQFFVNETTRDVYFNRESQIYHSRWTGSGFDTPTKVEFGLPFVGEASTTQDGSELYFVLADPTTNRMTIMVSKKLPSGSWDTPQPVD